MLGKQQVHRAFDIPVDLSSRRCDSCDHPHHDERRSAMTEPMLTEPMHNADELLALLDLERAHAMEEMRRIVMMTNKNVQKDCPFSIGEIVFDKMN